MIKINRKDLKLLALNYILANTPASLFEGLKESEVVLRLKNELSVSYIANYFNNITSLGKRSEVRIALSYALLIAYYSKFSIIDSPPTVLIKTHRLRWGSYIADIIKHSGNSESSVIINNKPKIIFNNY